MISLRSIPTQVANFPKTDFPATFWGGFWLQILSKQILLKVNKQLCATQKKTEEAIVDRNNVNAIPGCPHDLRLGGVLFEGKKRWRFQLKSLPAVFFVEWNFSPKPTGLLFQCPETLFLSVFSNEKMGAFLL